MKMPRLSRFTKIGIAGLGGLLVAWLGLALFTAKENKRTEAVVTTEKRCPTCGRPLSSTAIERNVCPYCLLERGEEAAAIRKSGSFATSKWVPVAIVGTIVFLLMANVFFAVRGRLKEVKDETYFYYNCPKCSRKLRYRERQIGKLAQCPLCERPIVFPRPAEFVDTPWKRLRRWLLRQPA
jgi:DNA-directed RNA polymerase subunit RPC12/RpoP